MVGETYFLQKMSHTNDIKNSNHVYIIGAGPGDPELITLKAYKILRNAEVVIYDRLIASEILDMINSKATLVYAGKSCKHHHMTQESINNLLVEYGHKRKVTVRLKCGDPLIFGRGGEEIQVLLEHNIDFTVIPGVSAALGCASYYGIPLTHRDISQGLYFITGHRNNSSALIYPWDLLAKSNATIVIYMGLGNIEYITTQLLNHSMDVDTPAIVIQNGTCDDSRMIRTSLKDLCVDISAHQFASPTIIIIGRVVSLYQENM